MTEKIFDEADDEQSGATTTLSGPSGAGIDTAEFWEAVALDWDELEGE